MPERQQGLIGEGGMVVISILLFSVFFLIGASIYVCSGSESPAKRDARQARLVSIARREKAKRERANQEAPDKK